MRYTKPNVLKTITTNAAIQAGQGSGAKLGMQIESTNPVLFRSTTGAYEADE
jgi:hypothetical protein